MKIFIPLITAACFFSACNNDKTNSLADAYRKLSDTTNYTTIEWIDTIKNVGLIKFGEKTEIEFGFKNTGDKPLLVMSAQPSCGCTVADYPKEAISPGKGGIITAGFDSNKGSVGAFKKTVTVTTNTKGSKSTNLVFKGEIKK